MQNNPIKISLILFEILSFYRINFILIINSSIIKKSKLIYHKEYENVVWWYR